MPCLLQVTKRTPDFCLQYATCGVVSTRRAHFSAGCDITSARNGKKYIEGILARWNPSRSTGKSNSSEKLPVHSLCAYSLVPVLRQDVPWASLVQRLLILRYRGFSYGFIRHMKFYLLRICLTSTFLAPSLCKHQIEGEERV